MLLSVTKIIWLFILQRSTDVDGQSSQLITPTAPGRHGYKLVSVYLTEVCAIVQRY